MTMSTPARRRILYLSPWAIVLLALANPPSVGAHPHDILAQCQLTDGTWKMCDETIHDLSGAHVPKEARPAGTNNLTTAPKNQRTGTKKTR
jgi:hypothetical protein